MANLCVSGTILGSLTGYFVYNEPIIGAKEGLIAGAIVTAAGALFGNFGVYASIPLSAALWYQTMQMNSKIKEYEAITQQHLKIQEKLQETIQHLRATNKHLIQRTQKSFSNKFTAAPS